MTDKINENDVILNDVNDVPEEQNNSYEINV